jgi:hypothetical protein
MRPNRALFVSVLMLLAGVALVQAQSKSQPVETLTAFAASMQSGKSGVVNITINRWSTEEERDRLIAALQEGGESELLKQLEAIRPPVGFMRTPNSIGYDLYYARQTPLPDGGRRIVVATNRRIAMGEAFHNTRSMQYQVTVAEIHLDKDGKGDGKLVPAAKVTWDRKNHRVEVENYQALPIDLVNVKSSLASKS